MLWMHRPLDEPLRLKSRPYVVLCGALLTHHVRGVPFVFSTDVLQQIRVHLNGFSYLDRPRLCVSFGIVDGHFDFQLPEVWPPESLRNFGGAGERGAVVVGPQSIAEASRLHHQSVPVPLSRGVTQPRGLRIGEHRPPIGEDLTLPLRAVSRTGMLL